MKRIVVLLAALVLLLASACAAQQGNEVQEGQDSSPVVTVYQAPT